MKDSEIEQLFTDGKIVHRKDFSVFDWLRILKRIRKEERKSERIFNCTKINIYQ